MKIAMRIYDNQNCEYVENDTDLLMKESGQDRLMRFEDFAIQSDGTLIVCDKCGNFGYLNQSRFELKIMTETC